ncbi:MAG: hypothetical protein WCS43_11445 [Verrucomicrobiota bacterium]
MKRFLKWLAVAGLAFTLSSCGLPAAAARTVSNTVKGLGGMASRVGGTASSL